VTLHYRTLLNDDGTLERSLQGDKSFAAAMLRSHFAEARTPGLAMKLSEIMGDRLEGRPVQKVQAIDPQPITIVMQDKDDEVA